MGWAGGCGNTWTEGYGTTVSCLRALPHSSQPALPLAGTAYAPVFGPGVMEWISSTLSTIVALKASAASRPRTLAVMRLACSCMSPEVSKVALPLICAPVTFASV
jgi:hypothetical protein